MLAIHNKGALSGTRNRKLGDTTVKYHKQMDYLQDIAVNYSANLPSTVTHKNPKPKKRRAVPTAAATDVHSSQNDPGATLRAKNTLETEPSAGQRTETMLKSQVLPL